MKKTLFFLLISTLFTCQSNSVERGDLPVVNLENLKGETVSTETLFKSDAKKRVLVFISPHCSPCLKLLHSIAVWDLPQKDESFFFVFEGNLNQMDSFIKNNPLNEIESLMIFTDLENQFQKQLPLVSFPSLIGMEGNKMRWNLSGVLQKEEIAESILRSWINK